MSALLAVPFMSGPVVPGVRPDAEEQPSSASLQLLLLNDEHDEVGRLNFIARPAGFFVPDSIEQSVAARYGGRTAVGAAVLSDFLDGAEKIVVFDEKADIAALNIWRGLPVRIPRRDQQVIAVHSLAKDMLQREVSWSSACKAILNSAAEDPDVDRLFDPWSTLGGEARK